ncbi:MAG: hypothetical protein MUP45_02385, partial [Candidatus Marinimicrobia bacterium]|nr:hypothetical protein [Candidatus Neomarinimicrobiota bacterium]
MEQATQELVLPWIAVEQKPTASPDQKTSPQESVGLSDQIDLEKFYQDEIDRSRQEQSLATQKSWDFIENFANEKYPVTPQRPIERETRKPSITDKLIRKALFIEARRQGVKNMAHFRELVDYFESTATELKTKSVKVPKNLTEERKDEILTKWSSKGWYGDRLNFHETTGEKYDFLHLRRFAPVNLKIPHVRAISNFVSSENDPVKIAEDLQKLGFMIGDYELKSPERMEKLGQLFTAQNVGEAIETAQKISQWKITWFSETERGSQIDFLIGLAHSP